MLKRISSLVAVMFTGFLLIANPSAGVSTTSTLEATTTDVTTTITGDPPSDDTGTTVTVVEGDSSSDTTVSASVDATTTTEATSTTSTTTSSSQGTVVVTGPAVNTRFGYFQVEITVEDGVLTNVDTLQQPTDSHSRRINSQALPAYEEAALAAQSADFDHLSGATYTWRAYTESLQAALDEAGLSS